MVSRLMSQNPRFRFLTVRELELKLEAHTRHYIETDDERFFRNIDLIEEELTLRKDKK